MSDIHSTSSSSENVIYLENQKRELPQEVTFNRRELDTILRLYSRMVAANEWRDYAIGHGKEKAIFAVFRRSNDVPLYTIVKQPALARKQGAYSVMTSTGLTLKRGQDLEKVLSVLDRKLKIV